MTGFVANFPVIGSQPMANFFDPDTVQRHPLGFRVTATDPYWGGAEFMYMQSGANFSAYELAHRNGLGVMVQVPNTANLGISLLVNIRNIAGNEYGWFMMSGKTPVRSNASVAAATAIGIAGTGIAGANSAGKQLLGARVQAAATTTVVKNCSGISGQRTLTINAGDSDGWFVGIRLSGTGIAAGTDVTSISPDGRTITVNNAFTAQINGGTITGTYNDTTNFYNVIEFNTLIAQGAIT